MPHDVFISHSTRDKSVADKITSYLEQRGIRCWIAPRNIRPGRDWAEAIVDAIGECKLLVLVFSENANTSSQINREISVASNHDLPVIPFRIEDVEPSKKLQYYLSTPHWIDAFPPPLEKHLEYLVSSVLSTLPEDVIIDEEVTVEKDNGIDETVVESAAKTVSENIPVVVLATPKRQAGVERFFTFNETFEPISDRGKMIWVILTVFSCFAMIAGFTAAVSAWGAKYPSNPSELVLPYNVMTGTLIVCGWTLAFFARTHPMYGYFAGFMASSTLCFLMFVRLVVLPGGAESPLWVTVSVELLGLLSLTIGAFIHKPFLWIYSGCLCAISLLYAVLYRDFSDGILLLLWVAELGFVIYTLILHRKRNQKSAEIQTAAN